MGRRQKGTSKRKSGPLLWFKSAFTPQFEEFQKWMRESPDGEASDLFDDRVGGCQDFDLMITLDITEFEELILDSTPTITSESRSFMADMLVANTKSNGLHVSDSILDRWSKGQNSSGISNPSREGIMLLRQVPDKCKNK